MLVPVSSIVNFLHVHVGIANSVSDTDARRLTHILEFYILPCSFDPYLELDHFFY
jgi:hypothetical protein